MINAEERNYLRDHAYIPEHLPAYGETFSGGEAFLAEEYVCYVRENALLFVGYPLTEACGEEILKSALEKAVKKFQPSRVTLVAPSFSEERGERRSPDFFYRLALNSARVPGKNKNMIRRAGRELAIQKHRHFASDHERLVQGFLASREVEEGIRTIFGRIEAYVSSSPNALIFDARDSGGNLAGFDIAEFGAKKYAFYLFNFRSPDVSVPGTSDLLLDALIREAQARGQGYLNLGLGINPGVIFFKKKWGAAPFLRHEIVLFSPSRPSLLKSILEGMFSP
jgi:hypothetical protein